MNKKYDPYRQNSINNNGNNEQFGQTQQIPFAQPQTQDFSYQQQYQQPTQDFSYQQQYQQPTQEFSYPQQSQQLYYPQQQNGQTQQIPFQQGQQNFAYPQQNQQTSTHEFFARHNYFPSQELSYMQQSQVPVREKTKLEEKLDALEKMFNDRLINSEEYYERRKRWIDKELSNLLK